MRVVAMLVVGAVAAAAQAPVRPCESLTSVAIADTRIESAAVEAASSAAPAFCRVTAVLTHPPSGDRVRIFVGLPLKEWNGRFEGVGGGGFLGGSPTGVVRPVAENYAAGATDTGHEGGRGSFALDRNGRLDWMLIRDNAYLGIHDMTVVAKALVNAFYGTPPQHSYFNGCSTGGRQGLSEAQRYPADYDGILSGAPAINWTKLHGEQMWGNLTMLTAHDFLPRCKFEAAQAAAVKACDADDGVTDGVIEDPLRCKYDPGELVGSSSPGCPAFTETDAEVIRKIWQGPRRRNGAFLWYGLTRGADFMGVSGTAGDPPDGHPFPITLDSWRYFLNENPQWDWKTLTPESYEQYWDQSVEEFSAVLATDDPDLTAFRERGGKILLWHGFSDQLIYPEGTIDYYQRVEKRMGGGEKTREFARLFLAPGVAHCGGGTGPQPTGQFDALVKWVEAGVAPEKILAVRRAKGGPVTRSRPLCVYPLEARYTGKGSTDDAANFVCEAAPAER